MQDLYLLTEFAGEVIAIESGYIESVVHIQDVVTAPQSDKSVAGIFALRSRVLTLLDSQYIVAGKQSKIASKSLAVIMEIAGHNYGLLVKKADDVVFIAEDQKMQNISVDPQWQKLVKEFAVIDGKTIMIINPEALVVGASQLAA